MIGTAKVWLGAQKTVDLYSPTDIDALLPYDALNDYTLSIKYNGPIEAPIAKDAEVATLIIKANDIAEIEYPLYAKTRVAKGGILERMLKSADKIKDELLNEAVDR